MTPAEEFYEKVLELDPSARLVDNGPGKPPVILTRLMPRAEALAVKAGVIVTFHAGDALLGHPDDDVAAEILARYTRPSGGPARFCVSDPT